jgi:hypothetical protein
MPPQHLAAILVRLCCQAAFGVWQQRSEQNWIDWFAAASAAAINPILVRFRRTRIRPGGAVSFVSLTEGH